jgi:hypothetical protein
MKKHNKYIVVAILGELARRQNRACVKVSFSIRSISDEKTSTGRLFTHRIALVAKELLLGDIVQESACQTV